MYCKNKFKYFASFILCIVLIASLFSTTVLANSTLTSVAGTEETPFKTYTYWEGLGTSSKTMVYCKPMYQPKTVIDSSSLGTKSFW